MTRWLAIALLVVPGLALANRVESIWNYAYQQVLTKGTTVEHSDGTLEYMPHPPNDSPPYALFLEQERHAELIESMGRVVGATRTYRRGDAVCRHEECTDMIWSYRLCFDRSGITDGELRFENTYGLFEVTFEASRSSTHDTRPQRFR